MKIKRAIRAAAMLLTCMSPAVFGLTVPVLQDSFSNAGGNLTVRSGSSPTLRVTQNQTAFIQFKLLDLSTVPASIVAGNVVSANLRIYLNKSVTSAAVTVHTVTSAWSEGSAGPAPSFEATPLATANADAVTAKNFVVFDVTDAVKTTLTNRNSDNGFAIVGTAGANLSIPSKEGTLARAELNIETNYASDNSGVFTNTGGLNIGGTSQLTGNVGVGTAPTSSYPLTLAGVAVGNVTNGLLNFRTSTGGDAFHLALVSGGLNFVETGVADFRLFLEPGGDVGIGTGNPAAKLDVRGNVKLGSSGELFATGSSENLRIVRGIVLDSGAVGGGSGFTATNPAGGEYRITFATPFTDTPSFTVLPVGAEPIIATFTTSNQASVTVKLWLPNGAPVGTAFNFIAVGAR